MEALLVLDSGRKSLCNLNRITCRAFAVSEDVESCLWRDREGFLLVADRGFTEDFPSDIERELGSERDRVVVCRRGKGEFVRLADRRLVGCVRHKAVRRSREDTLLSCWAPFLCSRG